MFSQSSVRHQVLAPVRQIGVPNFHTDDPDQDGRTTDGSGYSSDRRHRSRHHSSPSRPHKIDDSDKLDTGVNPTYKQWKDLLEGNMRQNRWKTEKDRMFYVFRATKGKARDYLHTRWGADSYDLFLDVADMLELLRQNFTNPNKVREAKNAYADLKQGSTPFPEFRAQFLMLAMQGHIPRSEFKDDLYRKLNPRVRELLSGVATELCVRALNVDNEVSINQKLAIAKKAARAALPTATGSVQKAYTPSSSVLPIRQSLPPAVDRNRRSTTAPPDRQQPAAAADTCHNCGKTGHWAKECPDAPKHHINEINKLYPRVMEVDTDDEDAGAASQPENGDA